MSTPSDNDPGKIKTREGSGKLSYKIKIENYTPLILNGMSVVGAVDDTEKPRTLAGMALPPRRSLSVSATPEMVNQLGLKKGIKVFAVDLSGL